MRDRETPRSNASARAERPAGGDAVGIELAGAASLRCLQGAGIVIHERDRFLGSFYWRKKSQTPDPSKNRKDRALESAKPVNRNGRI